MSLSESTQQLESSIDEMKKRITLSNSLHPLNLKTKKGQFNGVETITINGPGELYSYYFRWGERTSVYIDGKLVDSGSYNNRMYNDALDSTFGYYQYGSSVGWRGITLESFTYSGKPGFIEPLRFNEKLEVQHRSGSGTNDYYYIMYSTFD